MSEELNATTTEESAFNSEEDLKKIKPQQLEMMRKNYIKQRRAEVEVLEIDVHYLDLQLKYYDYSERLANIKEEVAKKQASEEFKQSLKV